MKIFNLWLVLILFSSFVQAAEMAGKVGYMSGTLIAQRGAGTVQVLGPKSDVLAGDMLVTGNDSYAQIQMNDGAKITLRPNSNLKIESFNFTQEKPEADNVVFSLLKGGFRALSGLIGKRGNADAYKLHAANSTIGIRGTDFSTRLCASRDCQDEESDKKKTAVAIPVAASQVIGRVMLVNGELSAKDKSGRVRKLLLGGPLYEGDELMTGSKSTAVVAFRDEGRISLQENTVFQVEKFKYNKAAAEENAVLRLFKGGVRVITGLIGHINHDNYQFHVANSTIGIRGTGFDTWCNGPCASGAAHPGATEGSPLDGEGVYVWSGEVALVTDCDAAQSGGACPTQIVGLNQAAIIARDTDKPVPVKVVPQSILNNAAPRPDSVPLDMNKLFGATPATSDPGVYVTVHDGQVILSQRDQSLDLGRGETGFAGAAALVRLAAPPSFMGGDMQINSQGGQPNTPGIGAGGCAVQ